MHMMKKFFYFWYVGVANADQLVETIKIEVDYLIDRLASALAGQKRNLKSTHTLSK